MKKSVVNLIIAVLIVVAVAMAVYFVKSPQLAPAPGIGTSDDFGEPEPGYQCGCPPAPQSGTPPAGVCPAAGIQNMVAAPASGNTQITVTIYSNTPTNGCKTVSNPSACSNGGGSCKWASTTTSYKFKQSNNPSYNAQGQQNRLIPSGGCWQVTSTAGGSKSLSCQ